MSTDAMYYAWIVFVFIGGLWYQLKVGKNKPPSIPPEKQFEIKFAKKVDELYQRDKRAATSEVELATVAIRHKECHYKHLVWDMQSAEFWNQPDLVDNFIARIINTGVTSYSGGDELNTNMFSDNKFTIVPVYSRILQPDEITASMLATLFRYRGFDFCYKPAKYKLVDRAFRITITPL